MTKFKAVFKIWLPIAFASTIISGLIYVSVQQNYRLSANDPQTQIAQDLSEILQNGKNASEIVGQTQVNISKSLATFIIIYNDQGKPVASQAVMDGRIPTPPQGVFDYTKTNLQNKITWQPKNGIRIAAIIHKFEGSNPGFILVGRSLREVEERVVKLATQVKLGLLVVLMGSFIVTFLVAG